MKTVVKCLIKNSLGEILVIKRAPHDTHASYWETPGGGVDASDTSDTFAAIREVQEEAGLVVNVTYSRTVEMIDDESGEKFRVQLFNGTPLSWSHPDLSENPDHTDFAWIDPENVNDNDLDIVLDSWTVKQLSYENTNT